MNAIGVNDFSCVAIRKNRKYEIEYLRNVVKWLYFEDEFCRYFAQ
jgi:hypothetical protein